MDLPKIVSEGFGRTADSLDSLRDEVRNGNIPVLEALGEVKAMLSELLAANGHIRSDFEQYQEATNGRLAKLERKASFANGAGHGAAE